MWCAKGHQRAYGREEREGFGSRANGFGCRMEGKVIVEERVGRERQDRGERETVSRWKRGQKGIEGVSTDKYLAISLCAPRREHKHKAAPSVSTRE